MVELGEQAAAAASDVLSSQRYGHLAGASKCHDQWGTGAAGGRERRQRDFAPHRQSAHPTIRHALIILGRAIFLTTKTFDNIVTSIEEV
jgi:hypothetical protein